MFFPFSPLLVSHLAWFLGTCLSVLGSTAGEVLPRVGAELVPLCYPQEVNSYQVPPGLLPCSCHHVSLSIHQTRLSSLGRVSSLQQRPGPTIMLHEVPFVQCCGTHIQTLISPTQKTFALHHHSRFLFLLVCFSQTWWLQAHQHYMPV